MKKPVSEISGLEKIVLVFMEQLLLVADRGWSTADEGHRGQHDMG